MAVREIEGFRAQIVSSLQRIVDCLDSVGADGLNWRPPAPEANSLCVIATHALANAEENLLAVLCGQPVERHRDAEFEASDATADAIKQRWTELQRRISEALAALTAERLEAEMSHPRRAGLVGREVLLVTARHAAEHMGQAELTRDLWLAL